MDTQSAYQACLEALEKASDRFERRIITRLEYEHEVFTAFYEYFEDDRPEDDIDFLIRFARAPVEAHEHDPLHGDRTATAEFDRRVQAMLHFPVSRIDLGDRLGAIRDGIAEGAPGAVEEMRSLCRRGHRDLSRIFMFRRNVTETLNTASQLGVVDALVDAVSPELKGPGQLGHPDSFGGGPRARTFDLLAGLATRGDETGAHARDALVRLASFIETAGMAVVRLPAYRLTKDNRAALFAALEAFDELIDRDPLLWPTEDAARVPHSLRSVLWLANDASQVS